MFLELYFSPRRLFKETKSIPAADKVIQAAYTHWVSSYESPYLPVCSQRHCLMARIPEGHMHPSRHVNTGSSFPYQGSCVTSVHLFIEMTVFRESNIYLFIIIEDFTVIRHVYKEGVVMRKTNESPCKSDKRKYLTVKVINGAVKQRPVKYISSHFSGELVMRPVTFSSSSNSEILPSQSLTSFLVKTKQNAAIQILVTSAPLGLTRESREG